MADKSKSKEGRSETKSDDREDTEKGPKTYETQNKRDESKGKAKKRKDRKGGENTSTKGTW